MESDRGKEAAAPPSVSRSDFYPVGSLDDKRNYKRFYRIETDGSIRESVHLDVSDASHREHLICVHYLRFLVRHFLRADIGVNMLGRDCPWDFKLQLSTGAEFYLEVTSIADSREHFEINKREERFTRWVGEELIPLHEVKKLADLFPTEELSRLASNYSLERRAGSDLVPNPLRDARQRVFLSSMLRTEQSLADEIQAVIGKKLRKKHPDKIATVLIIDNRTSAFDISDYRSAAVELESFLTAVPFPEVWFYTGYYSDDDGNRAEFSFAPLKVTAEQTKVLSSLNVNPKGVHLWS